jgi:hypothetical protein
MKTITKLTGTTNLFINSITIATLGFIAFCLVMVVTNIDPNTITFGGF